MTRIICISLAVLALGGSELKVVAQNEPPARQRAARLGRGDGRGFERGLDAMYERIIRDLEMDEAQQAQLAEIRAGQRARWQAFMEQQWALRQAESEGDEAGAAQLREEMRAQREESMRRGGPVMEAIASINSILTESQQERFSALRSEMREEQTAHMKSRFDARYERLAESLQLDEEQRMVMEEVKAAQVERMEMMRERWIAVRDAYASGDEALADQLRQEMREAMREDGGPPDFMGEVMTALDPTLSDGQRALAADLIAEREARFGDSAMQGRAVMAGEPQTMESEPRELFASSEDAEPVDVAEAIGLDEQQTRAYAALARAHQEADAALMQQIVSLYGQLKTARGNDDTAMIATLEEEIAALEARRAQQNEAFTSEVEALLTADQKVAFAEYQSDLRASNELNEVSADLRTVLRAAMRLKLEREQKTQIREMAQSARKAYRTARETDRRNRDRERTAEKALADQYRDRIIAVLNDEQSEAYLKSLERMSARDRAGRRR